MDKTKQLFAKKFHFQKSLKGDPWSDERFDMFNKDILSASDLIIMMGFLRHITLPTEAQLSYVSSKLSIPRSIQIDALRILESGLKSAWDEVDVEDESIHEKIIKKKPLVERNLEKDLGELIATNFIQVSKLIKSGDTQSIFIKEDFLIDLYSKRFVNMFDVYSDFTKYLITNKLILAKKSDAENTTYIEIPKKVYEKYKK